MKKIIFIILILSFVGCSYESEAYKEEEIRCSDVGLMENSNVESICGELYSIYNEYFSGNAYKEFSYDEYLSVCEEDAYIALENNNFNVLDSCASFIEEPFYYLPDEGYDPIIEWCKNNFRISSKYETCER